MRASFYILACGFLTGVFIRSFFVVDGSLVLWLFVSVLCVGLVTHVVSLRRNMLYGVFFMLAGILGIVRTELAFQGHDCGLVFLEGERIERDGVIVREVDDRGDRSILTVTLEKNNAPCPTTVRVTVPPYPQHRYGERVSVAGMVHVPTSFETDTGRIFNYAGYLMKDRVHYELRSGVVQGLGAYEGNMVTTTLLSIKARWLEAVSFSFPEPEASLLGGVVVGAKRSLGDKLLQAFRDTGLVHIVVLSGYNLTLVANSMVRMATRFSPFVRLGIGTLGVSCFAIMVGPGATVVRASLMAVIGMLAVYAERTYIVFRALLIAGISMVAWNPFLLVYDPGFQLSFFATIGLIFLSPLFVRYLTYVPEAFGLREIVSATFATQIMVLPLLLYQVGTMSIVAPLLNVLVLPIIPAVMLLGSIAGAVGMASTFVGTVLAWPVHVLLGYVLFMVDTCSRIPFSSVAVPALPAWSIGILYGVMALFLVMHNKQRTPE